MKDLTDFDAAFGSLFAAAHGAVLRLGASREVAQDAASEALYRASVRWSRIANHAEPWVIRVAVNVALDELRRTQRRRDREHRAHQAYGPVDHDPIDRLVVAEALAQLPKRQREVAVLRHLCGRTDPEIAALLGIAQGTVKVHARRASEALRRHLQEPAEDRGANP